MNDLIIIKKSNVMIQQIIMCIIERNMKNILKQYPLKMGMHNDEIIVTAKACVETSNKYYTVVECLYSSKSGFKYRINYLFFKYYV